jgi:hypothetical protein
MSGGRDSSGFALDSQLIADMVAAGTRRNGKALVSPEQAKRQLDCALVTRRINDLLCIDFHGQRWSLKHLPWAGVGEVVLCRRGDQADSLHVSSGLPEHPDAYALLGPDCLIAPASALDQPAWPAAAILGGDYVRHPASPPVDAKFCAQCGAALCQPAAQPTPASGVTA